MPKRCIAANCSNVASEHISLFGFPKDEQLRHEWTRQVQRTRADWKGPTATSFLCSAHFTAECFDQLPSLKESLGFVQKKKRLLLPKAIPTEFSRKREGSPHQPIPKRVSTAAQKLERKRVTSKILTAAKAVQSIIQPECMEHSLDDWIPENMHTQNVSCQTEPPKPETRDVSVSMRYRGKTKGTQTVSTEPPQKVFLTAYTQTDSDSSESSHDEPVEEESGEEECEEEESEQEEPPSSEYSLSSAGSSDISYAMEDEENSILDDLSKEEDKSPHKAKKYIVFFSAILQLLSFCTCPECGHKDLSYSTREIGTMMIMTLCCIACGKSTPWHSQPYIGNIPAGNILLSAATLFAGASVKKVHKVLSHMGVALITPRTFFRHQSDTLHKAVRKVWNDQQTSLMAALQDREKKLICGGDGRADSPGHSAKFGTYTLIELQEKVVLDIQLVQSNECGGSYHMEKEGLVRSLQVLRDHHLEVDVLVTDRHRQIAKFLREEHPTIDHLFDVWHVAKGVKTKLRAAGRKAGCQDICSWISSIINHLYWAASSTPDGQGELIEAKWCSVLDHIQNQHQQFDGLFPQCSHGELEGKEARKNWIAPDSRAATEIEKVIINANLRRDVRSLSGNHQTSVLEAFHSVLNHFAPKMLIFSFEGMLCRVMLAALHYNENSGRQQSTSKDGRLQYSLHYPKFKQGGHVVRKVLVPQTFEYVDILMKTVTTTLKKESIGDFTTPLQVPNPLNASFTHPDKDQAVLAHVTRFRTT